MGRMRLVLICVLALLVSSSLFALDISKAITQYVHDSWGVEQGLPHGIVTAVTQTRDGYLWVGTKGGLARFDGIRAVLFLTQQITPQVLLLSVFRFRIWD
jgi:ligand-binding sensor domain-containing protein